ncbi:MAG: hypothetical protein WAM14_25790 [Candidatus Nitrosopolaris sp.]
MSKEEGFKEEHFDELISVLSELVDRSNKEIELNETQLREFEKVKLNETLGLAKTRIAGDAVITSYFNMSYRLMRVLAIAVKAVAEAINKLPAQQEFDAVREELHSMNKVVKEVVVPLKQSMEERKQGEKQRDIGGDEVYK